MANVQTTKTPMPTFQEFTFKLMKYWTDHGCIMSQPYDAMMGAGTFHPHTFLKGIGPEPWRAVYVQPCRRPVDGRYGKSPYRFQHYYQLQVLLKPSPANIVDLFLKSLEEVGIPLRQNDISLLEDDWKGPTLGAWGLGWEVRANGQEITQFTYFQQLGGIDIEVVSGEITYGLERLYMYATGIKNGFEIPFNEHFTYGDIFQQGEFEFSHFNFKEADTSELFRHFSFCEAQVARLCEKNLVLPAYDFVLQASHAFNLLDARGAISVSERQRYIGRVRDFARQCATMYRSEREKAGFPMLERLERDARQEWVRNAPARMPQVNRKGGDVYKPSGATSMTDVVLELGCEELPPSFQGNANQELRQKWETFVSSLREMHSASPEFLDSLSRMQSEVFVGSRRIALLLRGLPVTEPARSVEIWGPAERIARAVDGGLSPAGIGFCKKNGIDPKEANFSQKADGTFLHVKKVVPGRDLPMLVAEAFRDWVAVLPAPLVMRWLPAEISPAFVRPVRWILALAGDRVIPIEAYGLQAGRETQGQRILSPGVLSIERAGDYSARIREAGVEPSWQARKEKILGEARTIARKRGASELLDEALLDKCAGLSESPHVFEGNIGAEYMKLPARLIKSVLKENMNFFAMQDSAGTALPFYIGVAGYRPGDEKAMISGTQDVVVGRLSDGTFYYDGDLATPLADFREKLRSQLLQEGMGSLYDKTERMARIVEGIGSRVRVIANTGSRAIGEAEMRAAVLAARFSKADLKSGCVQEFPDEMQGIMGGVLARHQKLGGEDSALVAGAIESHYEPVGASSPLPGTPAGLILSLADKLDTLAMFVNGGFDIKGNKDPFGLRRSAIGVLRVLGMDVGDRGGLMLGLGEAVDVALKSLEAAGVSIGSETREKVVAFLMGRLRAAWRDSYDPGAVDAVCARVDARSLFEARELVAAASQALKETGEASLSAALVPYRRARNLTQDISASQVSNYGVRPELFKEDAEQHLLRALNDLEKKCEEWLSAGRFSDYFRGLAALGAPLAVFFEKVLVNAEDPAVKSNRIALLLKVRGLYEQAADFSKVQV